MYENNDENSIVGYVQYIIPFVLIVVTLQILRGIVLASELLEAYRLCGQLNLDAMSAPLRPNDYPDILDRELSQTINAHRSQYGKYKDIALLALTGSSPRLRFETQIRQLLLNLKPELQSLLSSKLINPTYLAYIFKASQMISHSASGQGAQLSKIVYACSSVDIITPLLMLLGFKPGSKIDIYMLDITSKFKGLMDKLNLEGETPEAMNKVISRFFSQFYLLSVINSWNEEFRTELSDVLKTLLINLNINTKEINISNEKNTIQLIFMGHEVTFHFIQADICDDQDVSAFQTTYLPDFTGDYLYINKAGLDALRTNDKILTTLGRPKYALMSTLALHGTASDLNDFCFEHRREPNDWERLGILFRASECPQGFTSVDDRLLNELRRTILEITSVYEPRTPATGYHLASLMARETTVQTPVASSIFTKTDSVLPLRSSP